jgi:hypothetical protein
MSAHKLLITLGITAVVVGGCSSSADVQWMKVGQPYTAADFRRDYTECDKTGKLDECLRGRGWVSVTAPPTAKQTGTDMRTGPGTSTQVPGRR